MNLILGYPTDEIAFIGLFTTNMHYQNKRVGSNIIRDVCNYLKQLGYMCRKSTKQFLLIKKDFILFWKKEFNVMELAL